MSTNWSKGLSGFVTGHSFVMLNREGLTKHQSSRTGYEGALHRESGT